MLDHSYKLIEIVGSSTESLDQAIRNAVAKASSTVRNLEWYEVAKISGHIRDGKIEHHQVTLKMGFRLE